MLVNFRFLASHLFTLHTDMRNTSMTSVILTRRAMLSGGTLLVLVPCLRHAASRQ